MAPLKYLLQLPRLSYIEELLVEKRVLIPGLHDSMPLQALTAVRELVVVDPSPVRVRYHQNRLPTANASYWVAPLTETNLPSASFDVVLAFQPPLLESDGRAFLQEVRRLLAPDGFFFFSLPGPAHLRLGPHNPTVLTDPQQLKSQLRRSFAHVELLHQQAGFSTIIAPKENALPSWRMPGTKGQPQTSDYIFLCSQLPIEPDVRLYAAWPASVVLDPLRQERHQLRQHLLEAQHQLKSLQERLAAIPSPQAPDLDRFQLPSERTNPGQLPELPSPLDEATLPPPGTPEREMQLLQELARRQEALSQAQHQLMGLHIAIEESEGALETSERLRRQQTDQLTQATRLMEAHFAQHSELLTQHQLLERELIESRSTTQEAALLLGPATAEVAAAAPAQKDVPASGATGEASSFSFVRSAETADGSPSDELHQQRLHYEKLLTREQLKGWMLEEKLNAFQRLLQKAGLSLPSDENTQALFGPDEKGPDEKGPDEKVPDEKAHSDRPGASAAASASPMASSPEGGFAPGSPLIGAARAPEVGRPPATLIPPRATPSTSGNAQELLHVVRMGEAGNPPPHRSAPPHAPAEARPQPHRPGLGTLDIDGPSVSRAPQRNAATSSAGSPEPDESGLDLSAYTTLRTEAEGSEAAAAASPAAPEHAPASTAPRTASPRSPARRDHSPFEEERTDDLSAHAAGVVASTPDSRHEDPARRQDDWFSAMFDNSLPPGHAPQDEVQPAPSATPEAQKALHDAHFSLESPPSESPRHTSSTPHSGSTDTPFPDELDEVEVANLPPRRRSEDGFSKPFRALDQTIETRLESSEDADADAHDDADTPLPPLPQPDPAVARALLEDWDKPAQRESQDSTAAAARDTFSQDEAESLDAGRRPPPPVPPSPGRTANSPSSEARAPVRLPGVSDSDDAASLSVVLDGLDELAPAGGTHPPPARPRTQAGPLERSPETSESAIASAILRRRAQEDASTLRPRGVTGAGQNVPPLENTPSSRGVLEKSATSEASPARAAARGLEPSSERTSARSETVSSLDDTPAASSHARVTWPSATDRDSIEWDVPQRGETALKRALAQGNVSRLPSILQQEEDDLERLLFEPPLSEHRRQPAHTAASASAPSPGHALPPSLPRRELTLSPEQQGHDREVQGRHDGRHELRNDRHRRVRPIHELPPAIERASATSSRDNSSDRITELPSDTPSQPFMKRFFTRWWKQGP